MKPISQRKRLIYAFLICLAFVFLAFGEEWEPQRPWLACEWGLVKSAAVRVSRAVRPSWQAVRGPFPLEYHIAGSCPEWARAEVQSAFTEWQWRTAVTFTEVPADGPARITVRCVPRQHECPYPFSGALAHAFAPPVGTPEPLAGDIHLNMEARDASGSEWDWQAPGRLRAVVMHEIGHTLGLGHLSNTEAVMNDYYRGPFRHLTLEDLTYAAELLMVRNVVPAAGGP